MKGPLPHKSVLLLVYATRLPHHIHVDTDVALLYAILCGPTDACKTKMSVPSSQPEIRSLVRPYGRSMK